MQKLHSSKQVICYRGLHTKYLHCSNSSRNVTLAIVDAFNPFGPLFTQTCVFREQKYHRNKIKCDKNYVTGLALYSEPFGLNKAVFISGCVCPRNGWENLLNHLCGAEFFNEHLN